MIDIIIDVLFIAIFVCIVRTVINLIKTVLNQTKLMEVNNRLLRELTEAKERENELMAKLLDKDSDSPEQES